MAGEPRAAPACSDELLQLIQSVRRHETESGFPSPGLMPPFDGDLDADDLDIRDDSLQAMRTKLSQIHAGAQSQAQGFGRLFGAGPQEQTPAPRGETFLCDLCGQGFRLKTSLRAHIAEHLGPARRRCGSCGETLQTAAALVHHVLARHLPGPDPGGQGLQCSACEASFPGPAALLRHLPAHDGRAFPCPACGRRFHQRLALRLHLRLHAGADIAECAVCARPFTDRRALRRHLAGHARGGNHLPCRDCDLWLPSRALLRAHRRSAHPGLAPQPCACPLCGEACARSQLARHCRAHLAAPGHACPCCPRLFATRRQLAVHARTHSGERPYSCRVCSRTFAHSGSLATHLRLHTGRASHACRYCDKTFSLRSNMRRHCRSHLDAAAVPCGACPRLFDSREECNQHARLAHRPAAAPRDRTCYLCDKVFTQPCNLARHLKLHILYCDLCGCSFEARAQLLRHLRQHQTCPPRARADRVVVR
ncbi:zinc finger protein 501-like [Bacillus rossius redtenbacheri]|uniref:zinc finger protein 501-like n=1 Tax=Bacillus rossius redtenbacheri TaxID=93214 RepID=UPI002FDC9C59